MNKKQKKIIKNLRSIAELILETEQVAMLLPPEPGAPKPMPQVAVQGDRLTVNPLPLELADWRRERGYTQENLAEMLGVQVAAVHRWENDKRPMVAYLWLALNGIDFRNKELEGENK